mmetsp:Transcript_8107/g.18185  ORF Transcript_8107/g.18185 Transcript_8107/m.18185 type:complete len:203 (-) Transcript_8107:239-847(-)
MVGQHDDIVSLFHLIHDFFNIVAPVQRRFIHVNAGAKKVISHLVQIQRVSHFLVRILAEAHLVIGFKLELVGTVHTVRHGELNAQEKSFGHHVGSGELRHFLVVGIGQKTGLTSRHVFLGKMFEQGEHDVHVLFGEFVLDLSTNHAKGGFEFRLQQPAVVGSGHGFCFFNGSLQQYRSRQFIVIVVVCVGGRRNPGRSQGGQ